MRALLERTEGSPLPAKAEIDLVYEERRTRDALTLAREEVERHGLSTEEIDRAQSGEDVLISSDAVRRVLQRNQLWTASADDVLAALSPRVRDLRYTIAVLGELVAALSLDGQLDGTPAPAADLELDAIGDGQRDAEAVVAGPEVRRRGRGLDDDASGKA